MFDVLGVSLLGGLTVVFGWSTRRAWKAKRRVGKWFGAVSAGLLTVMAAAIFAAVLVGFGRLNRKYDNPLPSLSVAATPEQIAKGERLGRLCEDCHSADGAEGLGGQWFLEDAPPIGTFYAPNLTPTHLEEWTDGEIVRAIREGIHRSGRSLLIMPAQALRNLSDEDVLAVVAYLRSLPPIEPDTPTNRLNLLGAMMAALGVAPFVAQAPITEPVVAPPAGPTAAYGEYLASYACTSCHGADLAGDEPSATPGLRGAGFTWNEDHFIHFIRTGERPSGPPVDGELMPWADLSEYFQDDDELRAIFAHLGTLTQ